MRPTDTQAGSLIYPLDVVVPDSETNSAARLPCNEHVSSPLVFTGIFSAEECERIILLGAENRWRAGTMMYAKHDIRKSTITWIAHRSDSDWLYKKLWQTFSAVNRWYCFQLAGMVDELQLAKYECTDRFDWHMDAGGGRTATRKLSMSVQLSNEAVYAGGELEFSACAPLEPRRRQGAIIVFPSFLSHRVTPITQGSRYSLVAWAHGPTFK